MKKKKVTKKKKPNKQKIDVVLESLLNLEQRMRELINKIDQLSIAQKPQELPKYPQYWPPYRYDGITWTYNNKFRE